MRWQGDIRDKERAEGTRRLYIIEDAEKRTSEGKRYYWGVSERAGIVELRRVANGTRVYLACTGRSKPTMVNGRELSRLNFEVFAERLSEKPVAFAPISEASGHGPDDEPPPSDDDIPF